MNPRKVRFIYLIAMSLSALRHLMITPEVSCVHLPHRDEREADERGNPAADWGLGGRLPAKGPDLVRVGVRARARARASKG